VTRQRKVEIQEHAVGAESFVCYFVLLLNRYWDTSSSGFRPRTVQENAGYTLKMAVTGSLVPHQTVVHHGKPNDDAKLSAMYVTENIIYKRLYLVSRQLNIWLFVIMPLGRRLMKLLSIPTKQFTKVFPY